MFMDKKDLIFTQPGEVTLLDIVKVLSSAIGTLSII